MCGDRIRGSGESPPREEKRVEEWRIADDIVELIELYRRQSTTAEAVVIDGSGRRRDFWMRWRSWRWHMCVGS